MNIFKVPTVSPGLRLLSVLSMIALFLTVLAVFGFSIGQSDRNQLEKAMEAQTNSLIGKRHAM